MELMSLSSKNLQKYFYSFVDALGILRFCLFYNISLTFNDGGLWLGGGGLSGLAGEDEGLPVFSFSKPKSKVIQDI